MAKTTIADVQNQVQKFWAPIFMKELRAQLLLGALVDKSYDGEIKKQGDTVHVSQIVAPTGELKNLTTNPEDNTFATEKLQTKRVSIKADRRAVAAFEFDDLTDLQSQIESEQSEIRAALLYAVERQIEGYLRSLVNAAAGNKRNSVATLNAVELSEVRILAGENKWLRNKEWYGLLSPRYNGQLVQQQLISSSDFGASDAPVISGQIATKRMNFNLLEDDYQTGMNGLFFHPDFIHMVMQKQPTFKVSDLHANQKFGYLISVDAIFGAAQGIDGDKKHITVTSAPAA